MPAVNPDILHWARKTAGLSLDEAARAIDLQDAHGITGPKRLEGLEKGEEEPSRPLLLRMAKAYRRSLLVFYLERPPETGDRGKDFRTVPGGKTPLYNPVLDTLIRDVRGRQSIIRSLLEDEEAEKLKFVGSATMEMSFPILAERIVHQIGFNLKPRRTPVGDGRIGNQIWVVAEHGMKAGYVRNIERDSHVRLKLREGFRTRWHTGNAHLLPDDDARERQRWLASQLPSSAGNARAVRLFGTQLLTVRIDLDC
jgi:hypothetical protein